jgi:hypothetical protein
MNRRHAEISTVTFDAAMLAPPSGRFSNPTVVVLVDSHSVRNRVTSMHDLSARDRPKALSSLWPRMAVSSAGEIGASCTC